MIQNKLQLFLDNTMEWLSKWRLKLSINKTVFIIFNKAGKNLAGKIEILNNLDPIVYENNPRLLEVVLDPHIQQPRGVHWVTSNQTDEHDPVIKRQNMGS